MFKYYIFALIMLLSQSSFSKTEYIASEVSEQSEDKMMQILLLLEPIEISKHQQNTINNIKLDNKKLLSVLHVKNKEYNLEIEDFEDLKNKIITEKNNENLFIVSKIQQQKVTFNESFNEFDQVIANAAKKYQLDHALIKAIVSVESSFNPYASSPVGAKGLMQLMPATAKRFNVKNSFDAHQNIQAGAQYLSWLISSTTQLNM